jgi:hypothetical protein
VKKKKEQVQTLTVLDRGWILVDPDSEYKYLLEMGTHVVLNGEPLKYLGKKKVERKNDQRKG